jgi:hypothetical protein
MIMSLVSAVAFSTCLFAMSVFDLVADVDCHAHEYYWYNCNLRVSISRTDKDFSATPLTFVAMSKSLQTNLHLLYCDE